MNYFNLFLKGILTCFIIILVSCSSTSSVDLLTKNTFNISSQELDDFVKKNAPSDDAFRAVQEIASDNTKKRDWVKVKEIYSKYKPLFSTIEKKFDKIIEILNKPSGGFQVNLMPSEINTQFHEYTPCPTANRSKLYFTSPQRTNGYGEEDIYVSEFRDGRWQQAISVGPMINTKEHDAITSINPNDDKMITLGNYKDSYGDGDIFYVDRGASGWFVSRSHFPSPINTDYWEGDGFLNSDGNILLFVSDRKANDQVGQFHRKSEFFNNGYWGNLDIYVSIKNEDGKWGDPINLGPVINTPYAERTPCLSTDGKTLYFSSEGHPGLGKMDIYKSVRLKDDSWTEWSEPVNLGKQINTAEDDWGYKIIPTGEKAYYSSNNPVGNFGGEDIYEVNYTVYTKPLRVAKMHGVVTDNFGQHLEGSIKWEDLDSNKVLGETKSNPKDGSYSISLPLGKNYGVYVEVKGYMPKSFNLDLKNTDILKDTTFIFILNSIEQMFKVGESITLNNIFFDFDSDKLSIESFPELNRIAKIFKDNPQFYIEISGHTDAKGLADYNLKLSQKRAEAVVNYLISAGCNKDSFTAKGYGKDKPIATNETDEGRARNRRVEMKILNDKNK